MKADSGFFAEDIVVVVIVVTSDRVETVLSVLGLNGTEATDCRTRSTIIATAAPTPTKTAELPSETGFCTILLP